MAFERGSHLEEGGISLWMVIKLIMMGNEAT
jgi:hypothetical protein